MADKVHHQEEDDDIFIEDSQSEQDPITAEFSRAAEYLPQLLAKVSVRDEDLLYLYARFKYSIEGRCNTRRPGFLEFQAKKKWDAWNSLKDISQDDARLQYVAKIKELDPAWGELSEKSISENTIKSTKASSWVSVSSMIANNEVIPEENKNIFDWCREGKVECVQRLLERADAVMIDDPDEIGLTLLHWACDRGHLEMVRYLISEDASINIIDSEGQTPLHYACACGHEDIVKELLEHKANFKIKDSQGETPLHVADSEKMKKMISSWVFWRGSGESI